MDISTNGHVHLITLRGEQMNEINLSRYLAAIYRQTKKEWNTQHIQSNLGATQTDVLMFALRNPHQIQKDIARRMAIDPSLLTRDLKFLEKEGLIVRTSNDESRAYYIDLTSKGIQYAKTIGSEMEQWWQAFFSSHPEINQQLFTEQLKLVYEAFNADK